ncbi:FKBP-type peptidyl-prolyl cis-trans isomerase [Zunongwangia sp.]|uniref:FKBP-type peptidyl-prolyl cis-trans isomerase n=1 Tax=Zunongwangia sp. TaxID=1965325 RepID=UPI003AA90DF9
MQLNRLFFAGLAILSLLSVGCNDDDDRNRVPITPPRDPSEQIVADEDSIQQYMQTHFYNYEEFENPSSDFDYVVQIDTIAGENSDKTPLIDSDKLVTKKVTRDSVEYNIYILKVREGAGQRPTFADSSYVSYKGELLNMKEFDRSSSPVWFVRPGTIQGFTLGLTEFKSATGYQSNPDNSVAWNNDYGIGAIIMPSYLAYYNQAAGSIPAYSPLIFSVKLYLVNEADHDHDGVPSYMEDLNGNDYLLDDNTNGRVGTNGSPVYNFMDPDDDGDGTPTRDEIIINEDGTIEFPDTGNNGIPDYLDIDTFQDQTDNDN